MRSCVPAWYPRLEVHAILRHKGPGRSKLTQPVEIRHHAFCSRNCFVRFYRHHCLVCGKEIKQAKSPNRYQ